ncbi:mediator of RNA polymerase II transcription subunit 23 isoform X2 [Nymphaea colorata]|uniref:mediator of RNA polymerase II transcription subunit 23 isoform X2 n=1 Tax=Nymphaea colorata TaxID=210225 RepID=UPI00214E9E06|nr:mediator of RNA polymerase II transcription subunit 23 isoform X2 [Nymphaea colorata]
MELSCGGAPKADQFQPAQAAVLDIFNLYLGRIPKCKGDDSYRETPNKMQKRITAIHRELPPSNEQFLLDFEQLQAQFPDLATMIQKESIGWERALRCLRHALHATPSPDWWRRVLVIAPCYRQQAQQQIVVTGVVFSAEMVSEAMIDRIMELSKCTNSETSLWLEWLTLSDILYFLTKNGYIDFLDFVDKLVLRVRQGDQKFVRSNHITWLLTQIIRLEVVTNALNTDPKKVEAIRKIISFQTEERNFDQSIVTPQSILLEFISSSQSLRIWSFNPSNKDCLNPEQIQKGKQIEEWWRPFGKGERMLDFANLDDRSLGMFWVLSHTMVQSACDVLMNWLNSAGVSELMQSGSIQPNERMMVMRESCPLPMTFLSGLSIHLLLNLTSKIEDTLFQGQVIPSISLVEVYARILLIAPHSLFRLHFSTLSQRCPTLFSKPGASLLLLEILNYRLIPLYRYNGRSRSLLYDVSKTIASMKGKRGEHRSFRLAENLCMNLILSLRDNFSVKRDLKEPSELTETLNRICIVSLAIMSKTRGIGELDNFLYLQPLLEQILAASQHTWSEKTLRHFPPMIREFLKVRMDKRGQVIQAWQQAEATVINQCTQLLSPQADPTYVMTYINHSFPQHRKYLCAGAWMLMNGHPDNINSANLSRVLRELSPDEVTSNIYTMVDVLLHHIQIELQHGHLIQDLLFKASANLSFFIWTHELLPLDIVLLALADRDDDPHALRLLVTLLLDRQEFQQRVKICFLNRPTEHWLNTGLAKRVELQKALGNHLSGKDRYPPFFDDVAARMLPVIPLIVYRLIENDAADAAERLLATYSGLLVYHPLRFTFVREILAYFYGHLPSKLIVRILHVLDLPKIPFSESFPQHVNSSSPAACPPPDYFSGLLMGLVNNVMPPLSSKPRTGLVGDTAASPARTALSKAQSSVHSMPINVPENQKAFYQIQDPGNYSQLMLETAVIEILSLPVTATQIVSAFVQTVVHVQPVLAQSSYGMQMMQNVVGQSTGLPTSPSGGSTDSMSTSRSNTASGSTTPNLVSRTGCTSQSVSCLMIQACGLLLAQLPPDFHLQLYVEASRIIKECWWLTDATKSSRELDSAVGYALWDPTWAAQDSTSTAIGNTVALLHAFFSNLPQEWLEGTQTVIKQLRPVNSVALLRIAFRIMGPLLPRLASTRSLFLKTLALLFNVMADVFGRNSQPTSLIEVKDISDIIDFLHHAVLYEGQGPVQGDSKPKPDTLILCGKMVELLRPDLQHLFCHLRPDPKISIYAATHPKFVQSTA